MSTPEKQPLSLPAAIYLGITGSSVLLILPVFVGSILQVDAIDTKLAGWLGSADLIGYALGSVLGFRAVSRVSWKVLATVGLVLMVFGNLASVLALESFLSIMALRIVVTGLGAGLVIAVPYHALALMPDPGRSTGLYWTFNVVGGSVALLIFPVLSEMLGPGGVFAGLAVLAASAIPVALKASAVIPESASLTRNNSSALFSGLTSKEISILISIALFNLGLGGVWAFIDTPARTLGLSGPTIGWILSGAYLVCMLGSSAAIMQGKKFGLVTPYLVAMAIAAAAIMMVAGAPTVILYIAALATINFFWNYSMTYQFAAVFETAGSTYTATLIFFAQSVGLMFGPALSGMISERASILSAYLVSAVLCLLSAAIYRVGFSKN